MSFSLLEHLAKQLNQPTSDVSAALSDFIEELKTELQTIHSTHIAGIGTFEQKGNEILFTPDEALSISVNNRYGALENELVHADTFEDLSQSSENHVHRNEENIEKSLLDDILPQPISNNFLEEGSQELPDLGLVSEDENPFDNDLLNTDQENSIFSSQKSSNETPNQNGALDAASMKEEDQNANQSDQESLDSNTEWSPFFEELEGEEFDIDTTIDLSADDWETEFPTPPSSPFSSHATNEQEDLYFDVDAAPDDTLFSTSNNANTEVTSTYDEDLSWAANPLDESTEFFEDDPLLDSSSLQQGDDNTQQFSAEDEFFSPVTGSVSAQTPDDTLFSTETIYAEDATQEADDTIFLAPDQTVQATDARSPGMDGATNDPYAPPSAQSNQPGDAADGSSVNPYAYQPSPRKSQSSNSFMMVAIGVVGFLLVATLVTYLMGWFPFSGTSTSNPPVVQNAPVSNEATTSSGALNGNQDPTVPANNGASNADPTVNPGVGMATESTNPPVESAAPTTNVNPAEQTPVIQRSDIIRSRGGWTIVVASELQRNSAERIVDDYTVQFSDRQYPVGIITTSINGATRHRVGVGQFTSRDAAVAALRNFAGDFPRDAWLSKIE